MTLNHQNVINSEDAIGTSTTKLRKQISELRDELASARGLIQEQQARISFLERQIAIYQNARSIETLPTPTAIQNITWPRRNEINHA